LVYDRAVERRCTALAYVDARGRAEQVDVLTCEGELAEWTRKQVRRYRWQKPVAEGTKVEVEVVYVPPVDEIVPPQPMYWRHWQLDACALRVAVSRAGEATLKHAEDACAPQVSDVAPISDAALRRSAPAVCEVTFVVAEGEVRRLDVFRCGTRLWQPVRDMLTSWSWPTHETTMPYTAVVQFNGDPSLRP
jgi:hypothetical protein